MTSCAGCKAPLQEDDVFLMAPGDRRPFCCRCVEGLVDGQEIKRRAKARAERRMLEHMLKERP